MLLKNFNQPFTFFVNCLFSLMTKEEPGRSWEYKHLPSRSEALASIPSTTGEDKRLGWRNGVLGRSRRKLSALGAKGSRYGAVNPPGPVRRPHQPLGAEESGVGLAQVSGEQLQPKRRPSKGPGCGFRLWGCWLTPTPDPDRILAVIPGAGLGISWLARENSNLTYFLGF